MTTTTAEGLWARCYHPAPQQEGDRHSVWGLNFGLKLPTGKFDERNGEGELAERTLQPGSGTTFYLYVPSAPAQFLAGPMGLSEPPGGDETILVVEDDEAVLTMAVESLSDLGYRVLVAHDGREALAKEARQILAGEMPQVVCGAQCEKPYACEFSSFCHADLPAPPEWPGPGLVPD